MKKIAGLCLIIFTIYFCLFLFVFPRYKEDETIYYTGVCTDYRTVIYWRHPLPIVELDSKIEFRIPCKVYEFNSYIDGENPIGIEFTIGYVSDSIKDGTYKSIHFQVEDKIIDTRESANRSNMFGAVTLGTLLSVFILGLNINLLNAEFKKYKNSRHKKQKNKKF